MGPFLDPAPGRLVRATEGYTLSADVGDTWAQVERIRLREENIPDAIADVTASWTRAAPGARAGG